MQIIGDHFTVPASWPADARAKLDLLLERAKATHTDELSVAFGDSVFSWHSGRGEDPIQTMSVTKSIVGLAIGDWLRWANSTPSKHLSAPYSRSGVRDVRR